MPEKIAAAAAEFIARRDRAANPPGRFDGAGRFWAEEACSCCRGIRTPSRSWPWPQMHHARTALHVAHVRGVPVAEVRRAARELDAR